MLRFLIGVVAVAATLAASAAIAIAVALWVFKEHAASMAAGGFAVVFGVGCVIAWLKATARPVRRGHAGTGIPSFGIELRSRINTKIAGVTHYRRSLDYAMQGDEIQLQREPDNQYDPNAIAIHLERTGAKVGYINRDLARRLAAFIDKGHRVSGEITSITGGGQKERGVNVAIWTTMEQMHEA